MTRSTKAGATTKVGRADKQTPTGELLRLLGAIEHGLQSASKLMARDAGVTAPQRSVLRVIARQPGASASEVADVVNLHASTVTGILHRLIERGLVLRKRSEDDARKLVLQVTEAGKKAGEARGGGPEVGIRRALAGFSQAEIDTAMRVLGAVSEQLQS